MHPRAPNIRLKPDAVSRLTNRWFKSSPWNDVRRSPATVYVGRSKIDVAERVLSGHEQLQRCCENSGIPLRLMRCSAWFMEPEATLSFEAAMIVEMVPWGNAQATVPPDCWFWSDPDIEDCPVPMLAVGDGPGVYVIHTMPFARIPEVCLIRSKDNPVFPTLTKYPWVRIPSGSPRDLVSG